MSFEVLLDDEPCEGCNYYTLSKLHALKMCKLLKELSIEVAVIARHFVDEGLTEVPEKDLIPGDVFIADIIDGCKNLESVELVNVGVDK